MMYTKEHDKEGGNNVVSLLWENLKRLQVLATREPFKEINFIMDNCGGQSMNRMVLRLLFFLVR